MQQFIELLQGFVVALRNLLSLALMEDGEAEGTPPIRLELFAENARPRVWSAFGASLVFSSILIVACQQASKGQATQLSKAMELNVGALPLVSGQLLMSVFLTLAVATTLSLTWRTVSRWTILTIWAGALAPWLVVGSFGFGLLVYVGGLPDATTQTHQSLTALGLGLIVAASVVSFWRGAGAMTRYVARSHCRRHNENPCPVTCRLWTVLVAWVAPLATGICLFWLAAGR